MLIFAEIIKKFDIVRYDRVCPEKEQNSGFYCYFGRVVVGVEDDHVHVDIAQNEE